MTKTSAAPRTELVQSAPPSFGNKIGRGLWGIAYFLLFRPSPRPFHAWRCLVLRLFGAKIGRRAKPYSSAKIWAPWNLVMGDDSTLGDFVDCYCVAPIFIGRGASVSQRTFLCSASRDVDGSGHALMVAPIRIEDDAWVAAEAYIAPGVTIGNAAVVAARSVVLRDVPAGHIVAGHPAKSIRRRGKRDPEIETAQTMNS